MANANDRSGHLITKLINHMYHIAAVIMPGRWVLLAAYEAEDRGERGDAVPLLTHGHFRDYVHL
jgi:hypothetical protein